MGPVTIPGCIVHCFGVITEHLFKDVDNLLLGAAQGLVLSDPFRCCGSAKLKNVSVPNISVVPSLPLLVSHVVGGDGAVILYEGEIRDVWISLANAGTVPVEQAHISLSGKNQESVLSVPYETLKSALPLKPGAEVTIPVTLKVWQLGLVDTDTASKNLSGSTGRPAKDGSSPMLLIHYAGPLANSGEPPTDGSVVPPGRRLVDPLNICVLQGLSFVKARLLSMEIPAHVGENPPMLVHVENGSSEVTLGKFRNEDNSSVDCNAAEFGYPKTRIDRDNTARILIPLEHFKLPVLDSSFYVKRTQSGTPGRSSSFSEKNAKAELNASIKNLISKIKVRWQSGRNSSGELNIKDVIQAALQTSVMNVLLPDPLTFGFKLAENSTGRAKLSSPKESINQVQSPLSKGSVLAHDMTSMEVLPGENCIEGKKATVLWSGVLSGVTVEVPPLEEIKHSFSLYFLVPGEYTLLAAAVIDDANDILRLVHDLVHLMSQSSVGSPHFMSECSFNWQTQGTFCVASWQGIEVAVKKLGEEVTADEDKMKAFRDELELLQKIRHPNVVQFLGAITQSTPMMIVTEYLPKGDAKANETPIEEPETEAKVLDIPSPCSMDIDSQTNNQLPQVITSKEISAAACDDKPDRLEIARLYNEKLDVNELSREQTEPSTIGHWEEKKLVSRDGQAKLKANVFFASFDQCSDKAAGKSACTALAAVIANWLQSNQDNTPTRAQFDRLIVEGSSEWRKLCDNQDLINQFPDKHFDIKTVLQAGLCPISVLHEKSFIGFFGPEKFETLKEVMSFD
ncbi:hypothetical protein ACSBR1_037401 [Camellia fascicularis]